ncbi:MAG: hypothetical protein KGL39_44515 [Patescibacteria group bacterium]|nr:hypothetical protein [Patescibacteria group bacterium]
MNRMKLGRLPATRPYGLRMMAEYVKGRIPAPPAKISPPVFDVRVDGNDRIGDCTMAGVDHLLGAWNTLYDNPVARPDESTIESTYFGMTGGQDTGLNEADVLKAWQQQGLFGNKIVGYAPVDPQDIRGLQQAIAYYGAAYLGIACPESCQEQFGQGQPWTYDPSSPIEGGHCIVAGGYDSAYVYCWTWGKIVPVTYSFFAHYLEETWCVIGPELAAAGKDTLNIDFESLEADLPQM